MPFNMHYGIVIRLCDMHQRKSFLTTDGGRRFTRILTERWDSHGMLTKQRIRALALHLRRVHDLAVPRQLPGSHAWHPERQECERRCAAGEPIDQIIRDLRDPARWGGHKPPSIRTIRRWCADKRWLTPTPGQRIVRILSRSAAQALDYVLAVAAIGSWHEWISLHGATPAGEQRFNERTGRNPYLE
jgi:hypothetical protein